MIEYDPAEARQWMLPRLRCKPFLSMQDRLPRMLDDFIRYDLHFMRVTGVLDENDAPGDGTYDEDEAFEFIYDAYLSDHPDDPDDDMLAAALLNRYMELQAEYLDAHGLAEP